MSPAQAELEERDAEIARLTEELRKCTRLSVEALGAVELAKETIAGLRLERDAALLEAEKFASLLHGSGKVPRGRSRA